jgi:choline dehydrogenase-like flavoprotein
MPPEPPIALNRASARITAPRRAASADARASSSKAAQEAGLPFMADFNAGEQEGTGFYQTTTRTGRSNIAVAYLKPAMGRKI